MRGYVFHAINGRVDIFGVIYEEDSFFCDMGLFALSAFADEAGIEKSKVGVYGGVSLEGTSTSSEYKMNFEVNQVNFPSSGGEVKYKKNNSKKLGYGVFLGLSGGEDCYYAIEANASFNHIKAGRLLTDHEANEVFLGDRTGEVQTQLKCTYGNEYGIALKWGGNLSADVLGGARVYGILGACTRDVRVEYNYFPHSADVAAGNHYWESYPCNYKKRVWGIAPGVGAEFKICDSCSFGLEYKYKIYQSADQTRDLIGAPLADRGVRGDRDLKARDYKLKTRQHNLSLRFVVNI